jgi:hypothetical protein
VTAGSQGPEPPTTDRRRLVPGEAGPGGYRTLVSADGEPHAVRDELASRTLRAAWRRSARPLLVIAQLSDPHVMDHQSPGRAELLDRYSDPDSPLRAAVGIVGTYRSQELVAENPSEWSHDHGGRQSRPIRCGQWSLRTYQLSHTDRVVPRG